ncbi:DUF2815 family protein [Acinetobacter sp. ANC 7454]|uniref:DUF2815 family protein n=1 Tax=Acinetobacter thermotolerans TaxID=3151487 RepID=UPI00325BB164
MKVKLNNVRLAFPNLFEAKGINGGKPVFSATFLMEPGHPAVAEIRAAFEEIGKEKWGAKWPTVKNGLEKQDKLALHDGDVKADYAGFEGNLYLTANSKTRPLVIDRDKTHLDSTDGKPYAGCYVNVSVELWCQDHPQHGKRINASLKGVQFFKDGDAFAGGGVASEDDFDDLSTDEEFADDPAFA